jgi:hypothetical protein
MFRISKDSPALLLNFRSKRSTTNFSNNSGKEHRLFSVGRSAPVGGFPAARVCSDDRLPPSHHRIRRFQIFR